MSITVTVNCQPLKEMLKKKTALRDQYQITEVSYCCYRKTVDLSPKGLRRQIGKKAEVTLATHCFHRLPFFLSLDSFLIDRSNFNMMMITFDIS